MPKHRRQMIPVLFTLVVMLLLCLTASPVSAEHEADEEVATPRHQFFYVGGGLAAGEYVEIEDDLKPIFAPFKVKAKEPVGVDLRAGYRMHRNIAAELQYQWFSPAIIKIAGIDALEVETWTLTGNLKVYIITAGMEAATRGMLHPFVVVGAGLMHFDTKDKLGLGASSSGQDVAARFGGGIDVFFHTHFGIYFDVTYVLATGDVEGLDQVGVTLWGAVSLLSCRYALSIAATSSSRGGTPDSP